ncbi:MAG: hypothetical protein ACRD5M_00535 [Candidatus Acidiferrales bacterium]
MDNKKETPASGTDRQLLRHTLATLAYRARKPLSDVPATFAEFRASEKSRTPGQILAHLADLMDWALSVAKGKQEWHNSPVIPWKEGVERFYAAVKAFDDYLASDAPLGAPAEKLFQGAIADSLTHVGQISFLRRCAGTPVRGENYMQAEIKAGRVGLDQAAPRREFD